MHCRYLLAYLLLSFSVPAFALNGVSRACRFDLIPSVAKGPAVLFFEMLGSKFPSLSLLPFQSLAEQSNHWILESITTDYGSVRYYLFAENRIYERRYQSNGTPIFPLVSWGTSPGWTAMTVRKEMYEDSRLAIFFANRGFLYSARAGDPDIVQKFPRVVPSLPRYFGVKGRHYYYDAVNKVVGAIWDSQATDCNLGQWGFGDR